MKPGLYEQLMTLELGAKLAASNLESEREDAGELASGDRALEQWAQGLRDHRVTALGPFFELPPVPGSRERAERRTPKVAREWGFLMDLDYDSFKSAFEKSSKSDAR